MADGNSVERRRAGHLTPSTTRYTFWYNGKANSVTLNTQKVIQPPPSDGTISRIEKNLEDNFGLTMTVFVVALFGSLAVSGFLFSGGNGMIVAFVTVLLAMLGGLAGLAVVGDRRRNSELPVKKDGYVDADIAGRVLEVVSELPSGLVERSKVISRLSIQVRELNDEDDAMMPFLAGKALLPRLTREAAQPSLSRAGAERLHDEVKAEYGEFLSDPLAVLDAPSLADGSLSDDTRQFERLMRVADDAARRRDDVRYGQVVLDLVEAWETARCAAEQSGITMLDADSQAKVGRARKLLATALDGSVPPHVAAGYAEKAAALLRGVVTLPQTTKGAIGTAVRKELPAQ